MRKTLASLVCLLGVSLGGALPAGAQTETEFEFDAPASVEGLPGDTVPIMVKGILGVDTMGDDEAGVQGWSLSMIGQGCTVTGVELGQDAVNSFIGGFSQSSLNDPPSSIGDCQDESGAVSAVVLSFTQPVTFTDGTWEIAEFDLEATAPSAGQCTECVISYVDGCRGVGQPVSNATTVQGNTVVPVVNTASILVCGVLPNTAPQASCAEAVNPSGKTIPPAGSTTLPGPKGGQNEDGFYEVVGEDAEDGAAAVFVTNASGTATFGPFTSGSVVKITEAPGRTPTAKPMGGPSSAVAAHITLDSDAFVFAVDSSGEESPVVSCLVPPPPK